MPAIDWTPPKPPLTHAGFCIQLCTIVIAARICGLSNLTLCEIQSA